MTSRSTSKKILQSFHVRENLWKLFERRAREMDCSVDYLVNEAMRLYATKHGFIKRKSNTDEQRRAKQQTAQKIPKREQEVTAERAPDGGEFKATASARPTKQAPKLGTTLPRPGRAHQPAPSTGRGSAPPPLPRPGGPPSRPPSPSGRPQTDPGVSKELPVLMLVFQGRKIPIQSEQFIIGRGSKSSDLAIKDANISRKHAAIIYHNGAYYLKDLGSTNGIEYNGKQVDSKRIDEGDVFSVCGYDLHFTYSP